MSQKNTYACAEVLPASGPVLFLWDSLTFQNEKLVAQGIFISNVTLLVQKMHALELQLF